MTAYGIKIEVKSGEVEKILEELTEAQEKIYDCYNKLRDVGILTISEAEEPAPEK